MAWVESFNGIGGAQRGPIGRIELKECQPGIQVLFDNLHGRRKQRLPWLFQPKESHTCCAFGGRLKDLVEVFGKRLSLLGTDSATGVSLGMLLTPLGLGPGKEALKKSFQLR